MSRRGNGRRAWGALGVLSVLALVASGCAPDARAPLETPEQASGALPADTVTQIEAAVQAAMTAGAASGAIVGVWAPWSGTLITALGEGASVDQSFRIADMTRMMTCDVLYDVADEGRLSLDDPVSRWVVGNPDLEDVTLLELCNGTAGLGSYEGALRASWISNPDRQWNPLEVAAFGLGQPRTEPGVAYRDSDAGYVLLGLALERATGKSAAALYQEYIAEPLGLENTALPTDAAAPPETSGTTLKGYQVLPGPDGAPNCAAPTDVTTLSASVGFTDSGIVSTVEDTGRYLQALGAQVQADEDSERWAAPVPASADAPAWFTATGGAYGAGSLVGQFGSLPGYITAGYVDPLTGMAVVVVLNNSTAGSALATFLAWQLAAIASKAPAASGFTAPEFGLPWTPEQYAATIATIAVCPPPAP